MRLKNQVYWTKEKYEQGEIKIYITIDFTIYNYITIKIYIVIEQSLNLNCCIHFELFQRLHGRFYKNLTFLSGQKLK